jgi:hypothetical protein
MRTRQEIEAMRDMMHRRNLANGSELTPLAVEMLTWVPRPHNTRFRRNRPIRDGRRLHLR